MRIKKTLKIILLAFLLLLLLAFSQTLWDLFFVDNFRRAEKYFSEKKYHEALYHFDLVKKNNLHFDEAKKMRERCAQILDSLKHVRKDSFGAEKKH